MEKLIASLKKKLFYILFICCCFCFLTITFILHFFLWLHVIFLSFWREVGGYVYRNAKLIKNNWQRKKKKMTTIEGVSYITCITDHNDLVFKCGRNCRNWPYFPIERRVKTVFSALCRIIHRHVYIGREGILITTPTHGACLRGEKRLPDHLRFNVSAGVWCVRKLHVARYGIMNLHVAPNSVKNCLAPDLLAPINKSYWQGMLHRL